VWESNWGWHAAAHLKPLYHRPIFQAIPDGLDYWQIIEPPAPVVALSPPEGTGGRQYTFGGHQLGHRGSADTAQGGIMARSTCVVTRLVVGGVGHQASYTTRDARVENETHARVEN
jgi:hypothetical protein